MTSIVPSLRYLFRNDAKILRTQHIRVGEDKCLLTVIELIHRQNGWKGDQITRGKTTSLSGDGGGKAKLSPRQPRQGGSCPRWLRSLVFKVFRDKLRCLL